MNKNIEAWLDELRSANWTQTIGCLERIGVGYCPLGVACALYQREVGSLNIVPSKVDSRIRSFEGSIFILPYKVADWLGCTMVGQLNDNRTIAQLNDHERLSFKEIADVIETVGLVEG